MSDYIKGTFASGGHVRPGQVWRRTRLSGLGLMVLVVKKQFIKQLGIDYYTAFVMHDPQRFTRGVGSSRVFDSIGSLSWELVCDVD